MRLLSKEHGPWQTPPLAFQLGATRVGSSSPDYGIETTFFTLVDDPKKVINRGRESLLIFLERLVAFSTIDYDMLLEHLFGLGMGGTLVEWLWCFLTDYRKWFWILSFNILTNHL